MNHVLNRLSIVSKLWLLTAISLLGLVAVSMYMTLEGYQQSRLDREKLVRYEVEAASGVLLWAHRLETSGQVPRDQAQTLAKQAIGQMRYGEGEYFFISDMQAHVVMHPIKPELNGKSGSAIRDPDGVALFEPWGWVVGSGLYLDDLRADFISQATRLGVVALLCTLLVGWLTHRVSRSIGHGIGKALNVVEAMSLGDLTAPIDAKGSNEVARLLPSMVSMQTSLATIVTTVRRGSEGLSRLGADTVRRIPPARAARPG